jgi:hypothetical protein
LVGSFFRIPHRVTAAEFGTVVHLLRASGTERQSDKDDCRIVFTERCPIVCWPPNLHHQTDVVGSFFRIPHRVTTAESGTFSTSSGPQGAMSVSNIFTQPKSREIWLINVRQLFTMVFHKVMLWQNE